MKNFITLLNIGVLLIIITMIITQSTISLVGGADGITDILIPTVYVFSMVYIFLVAIINIYWLLKKYPKDLSD